jgi:hypothetical protein
VVTLAALAADAVRQTLLDVLPVALVIGLFQALVLRARPARLRQVLAGLALVVAGLVLFRLGLALGLMPIGTALPERLAGDAASGAAGFMPLYLFAFTVALAATLAEPSLIAVADRVGQLTGGALRPLHLRLVVALGVGIGLVLGTLRIVLGVPLAPSAAVLVALVALLTWMAPRRIRALAFDLPPVTLSVVTVPLVAALGVGTARAIPGRDPLTDGFGIVLFALMLPTACVLALAAWRLGGAREGA